MFITILKICGVSFVVILTICLIIMMIVGTISIVKDETEHKKENKTKSSYGGIYTPDE